MRHVINVTILIIVATVGLLFVLNRVHLMPVAASTAAGPVDWLFGLHMDIITFLYVLINGIMLYCVFAFRRRRGDDSEGSYFHGNTKLELGWIIVPTIVVMIFAVLGASVLSQVSAADAKEMKVIVTGRQWAWTFEYPDLGITSTELNLPVNEQAHFILRSEDVIHSFWVPQFRLKQDLVPGQDKELRITPTLLGSYQLMCAELCGTSHAYMTAPVNVLSAADFEIWRQKRLGIYKEPEGTGTGGGAAAEDPVAVGKKVASSAGCVACHSIDGSKIVGPTWKGLAGESVTLADGSTVTADDAYLEESIVNPGAKMVQGYPDVMPKNFKDVLTADEIKGIIAYIKTLK